jgi:putative spermidine/putrescine transport system substrate-binding protein
VIEGNVQAELAKRIPYGPSSQDAFKYLSEAEAKDLNTASENLKKQFWNDIAWWGAIGPDGKTNTEIQTERYTKWMVQKS